LRSLASFLRDFFVGDDWVAAVGVVIALAFTALLTTTSVAAWWIMPVGALALLCLSVWRAVRADARLDRPLRAAPASEIRPSRGVECNSRPDAEGRRETTEG
jgi:hypothetical protein